MTFIAFYGTLRSGESNALTPATLDWLRQRSLGPCFLPGVLWAVGAAGQYPGLTEGAGRVVAELFSLAPDRLAARRVLQELDRYEEYFPGDPGGSLYLRRRLFAREPRPGSWLRLEGARGGRVGAFAYLYNRPIDRLATPRIADGDWKSWTAAGVKS